MNDRRSFLKKTAVIGASAMAGELTASLLDGGSACDCGVPLGEVDPKTVVIEPVELKTLLITFKSDVGSSTMVIEATEAKEMAERLVGGTVRIIDDATGKFLRSDVVESVSILEPG